MNATVDPVRPSHAVAIRLTRCPDCGARRSDPCVYMPVEFPSAANAHRVGQPTRHPHRGRLNRAREIKVRQRRAAELEEQKLLAVERPDRQIAAAEVEFERRERAALVAWLAQYAGVLIGATS